MRDCEMGDGRNEAEALPKIVLDEMTRVNPGSPVFQGEIRSLEERVIEEVETGVGFRQPCRM